MRKIAGIAVIALIAMTVACGFTETTTDDGKSKGTNVGADTEYDALKDAKVKTCKADEFGYAEAKVEVTNHGKKTAAYIVNVSFENKQGDQLATGTALVNDLAAGQKAVSDAGAADEVDSKDFTCRVSSVDRTEV